MTIRLSRESLLLASLVFVGWAAADNYGTYSSHAFAFVLCAALTACLALRARPGDHAPAYVWICAIAVLAAGNILLQHRFPAASLGWPVAVLSLSAAAAMTPRLRRFRVPALAVAGAALVALIALPWRWGHASIDVFDALTGASGALLHGRNPYSAQFPLAAWTWPGVTSRDAYTSIAHFQYGPMAAVLAVPGRLLGDARLSSALATAVLVAAVLLASRRSSSPMARLGAPLAVAVMPFTLGMIMDAWVDVFMMAGFAGWLILRREHPRLAVVCLAACILVKPTVGIALLPPFLWLRSARREGLAAAALAAVVIIPVAIATGPSALWHDIIGIQVNLPPRADGLTVMSWLYWQFGITLPTVVGTAAAGVAAIALLSRRPRDMTELLTRAAALSIIAFLFAKWAFFNYYYVSAVLLVLALASQGQLFDPEDVALPLPQRIRAMRWRLAAAA